MDKPSFVLHDYRPPGPVAARYIEHEGPIDLIMGPWGSGKTVATVFKILRHASNLFPVCRERYVDRAGVVHEGVIHVKASAIRDTYRDLAKTALDSWHKFCPKNGPLTRPPVQQNYSGGIDRPVQHTLEWEVIRWWPNGPRKTPVVLRVDFGAIGDQNLDSFFKGYEISMGWANECDSQDESVPGRLFGRTGRYPPRAEIMPWEGERLGFETDPVTGVQVVKLPRIVMGDYNPPGEDNWTYKRHIEEPEKWPDYHFFQQPSGLSPLAENRAGKTRSDYEAEERNFGGPLTPDSQRNVHGKYANKAAGPAIYPNYDMFFHRADAPLSPAPGVGYLMGFDGGGRPACVIAQPMPNGQMRFLREIVSEPDKVTSAKRFAGFVLAVLLRDFAGLPCLGAWGDPSDFKGADKEDGELALMETIALGLQQPIMPTESNDLQSRISALAYYVDNRISPQVPMLICCPSMKTFIRGMSSQYHATKAFQEGKTNGLEIVKNHFSHVVNAAEYLAYGYRGRAKVISEAARLGRAANVVPMRSTNVRHDFNVFER